MPEKRPSPEKLLQRAQDEERKQKRGKLKIYLGAAPGVGKTHAMLHDAMGERAEGLDVVIGVVESHGRKEIENMLTGFDILPRQVINYHDKQLKEFDLDAALQRSPGLILIDEMAHTNVPGLRHKKRWQDIEELLSRGINVYTTLNIQHIESLKDDVSQIIHAPIKETVPDSMIELADTIEVVDLPPEELLKRLQEGKVYVPAQAALAVEHFFRKGNLSALRELALRVTAERVGAQVLLYRQGQNIKHIWPTKEKILVCVGPGTESQKLIRAARRMSASFQAEWIAVYVDTPQIQSTAEKRELAMKNLRYAEQLGAMTRILTGYDIVNEVLTFAREQNATMVMIWKHIRTRWRDLIFKNLVDEMVRHSGEIDIYIMTGEAGEPVSRKPAAQAKQMPWQEYFKAAGIVTAATILNLILYPFLTASDVIMIYLLGVTVISFSGQTGPSVFASVLSVLLCDFFFIEPVYSFAVSNFKDISTLILMFIIAQVISRVTVFMRREVGIAQNSEQQTLAIYTLSRQLATSRGVDKLLQIATRYLADTLNCEVVALIPSDKRQLRIRPENSAKPLDTKEATIAQWVYEMGQKAGLGTDTLSYATSLYVPLTTAENTIAVLKLKPRAKKMFGAEQMQLLEECASLIAQALVVEK